MRAAAASALLFGCAWLAGAAPAHAEAASPRVYGIEIDARGEHERVLVFGDAPLASRLAPAPGDTLMLILSGARLDPSAPRRLVPSDSGVVTRITAFERIAGGEPEVRVVIEGAPAGPPQMTRSGRMVAVELPRPVRPGPDRLALAFEDTPLAEVVARYAQATGQRVVYDRDALRGRVTLAGPEPVTPEVALELLRSLLLLTSHAALPAPDGTLRIVPLAETGVPRAPGVAPGVPAATVVSLRDAEPEDVASALRPLLGSHSLALASPTTRQVVLAAPEPRLRRLLRIVHVLDAGAAEPVRVVRLRDGSAEVAAALLDGVYGAALDAIPDRRTNALVLRGAADTVEEARLLLSRVDFRAEGRGRLRVIPVRFANAEQLAAQLVELQQTELSRDLGLGGRDFSLAVDRPTSTLVVGGDAETLGILEGVVDALDVPPARIRVEAIVLEVATSRSLSLGFDWLLPLTNARRPGDFVATLIGNPSGARAVDPAGSGSDLLARVTRTPIVIPIVGEDGTPSTFVIPRESAVLTADGREVRSRLLSRPQLLLVSGESHEIFAGRNVPIPSQAEGAVLSNRQNVTREDVGVRLRVEPRLGAEGEVVDLAFELDVTRVTEPLAGAAEEVGVTLDSRSVRSRVKLRDGEVALVGMAQTPQRARRETGTPWLRSAPVLGGLFRRTEETWLDSHLIVGIQAHVLRDDAALLADSVRRRVGLERALARVAPLPAPPGAPFALRVTTLASERAARRVADAWSSPAHAAEVVRWGRADAPARYDVVLTGYASLAAASEAALRLRNAGWGPELVVLPEPADRTL